MPQPRLIVVANQKGGVGKSTLTGHLAVQAGLVGDGPVALIDTDKQGSLADWWNVREAAEPVFGMIEGGNLAATIQILGENGAAYVIIDTPPSSEDVATDALKKIMAFADLVLIPVRPSPHDLRAVGRTIEAVKEVGKPFAFVLTQAKQGALITVDTMAALSEHGPISATIIHDRVDYAGSMVDGRTVLETDPKGRSASEITALWEDVKRRFNGLTVKRFEENVKTLSEPTRSRKTAA